jgi:hypothetical protein
MELIINLQLFAEKKKIEQDGYTKLLHNPNEELKMTKLPYNPNEEPKYEYEKFSEGAPTSTPTISQPPASAPSTTPTTTPSPTSAYATGTNTPYVESDLVKAAKDALVSHMANKPGEYSQPWDTYINDVVNKILNREDFSYDLNGDALYQQYKDKYTQQGKMAMADTMGQAAAMTGGYGSSYAQSVGQQAYQAQLQNLNDIIPELYQMAYDRYQQKGQDLYNQYGMLSDLDNTEYGRYRDSVSDWGNERDYLTGRVDTERGFDYGDYRNKIGDSQSQAEFERGDRWRTEDWAREDKLIADERAYNDKLIADEWAREDEVTAKEWAREDELIADERAYNDKLIADEWAREDKLTADEWAREDELIADERAYNDKLIADANAREDAAIAEDTRRWEAEFNARYGIEENENENWWADYQEKNGPISSPPPELKYGSEGKEVIAIQQFLMSQGYEIEEYGIIGSETERAIKDYQARNNIGADGIVGPKTWNAILGKATYGDETTGETTSGEVKPESADDYADWDYGDWEGYFATIRNTEGKSAAEAELSRMIKAGYIPQNLIAAASSGARGGSFGH